MDAVSASEPVAAVRVTGRQGATVVIAIAGELDLASAPSVEAALEALSAEEPQRIVFDVAELTFLDSSGLAVLLGMAQRMPVSLRNANAVVQRIVTTTGLTEVLPIEPGPGSSASSTTPERLLLEVHEYPCTARSARDARQMVSTLLAWLSADTAGSVTAMVSELATNALVHARTSFELSVEVSGDRVVRVAVTDGGPGWPTMATPSATELHGRGLRMVELLSDAWGVHALGDRAGKTVWFEIRAAPDPQAGRAIRSQGSPAAATSSTG